MEENAYLVLTFPAVRDVVGSEYTEPDDGDDGHRRDAYDDDDDDGPT